MTVNPALSDNVSMQHTHRGVNDWSAILCTSRVKNKQTRFTVDLPKLSFFLARSPHTR